MNINEHFKRYKSFVFISQLELPRLLVLEMFSCSLHAQAYTTHTYMSQCSVAVLTASQTDLD